MQPSVRPSGCPLPDRRPTMNERSSNLPRIDAEEILEGIREWVAIESPTSSAAGVNAMMDAAQERLKALNLGVERIPGRDGYGDLVKARTPWGGDEPGILVLCHLDTVHPIGTLGRNSFRREGDIVYGPGIYDMKGGAFIALYALQHLIRQGKESRLPVTILYVSEEEVGSPISRAVIEAEAKKAKYVLVTEPAREGGKIVTARKGVARFKMTATGRPAHSGSRHQDGRSAIREIARQILTIEGMTDYERGVTTNCGMVSGGTAVNVVPASCTVEIDARLPDAETAKEVVAAILNLKPHDPDVELVVEGELNRPPFEKSEGISALFEHARRCAAEAGIDLQDLKTGGGSDGNFTAALGVPTLDGLGVDGKGGHTEYEQIYYSSLEPRTKMWVRLYETLA
ncbi:glutamate carboxypeptidase [Constrictibacter sp. MBR-5]